MFNKNKLINTIFNYMVEFTPHYDIYVKLLQYKQTFKLKSIQKHSFVKFAKNEIGIVLNDKTQNNKVEITELYGDNTALVKINEVKPLNPLEFKNFFKEILLSCMNESKFMEKLFKLNVLSLEKVTNRYTLKKSYDFDCETYFIKDNFIDKIFII